MYCFFLKYKLHLIAILPLLNIGCNRPAPSAESTGQKETTQDSLLPIYPSTPEDPGHLDDYHGVKVPDAYHWMESDSLQQLMPWLAAQQALTDTYMQRNGKLDSLKEQLTRFWQADNLAFKGKKAGFYYVVRKTDFERTPILYRTVDFNNAAWEQVFDPSELGLNKSAYIEQFSISPSGEFGTFLINSPSQVMNRLYIKNLNTGEMLDEILEGVKYSQIAWRKDGFFYSCFPQKPGTSASGSQERFHQINFHRIGYPQNQDETIFSDRMNPQRLFQARCTDEGKFLVISSRQSAIGNALYFRDLTSSDLSFSYLVDRFDTEYEVIGLSGTDLILKKNGHELIKVNLEFPDEKYWQSILAEKEEEIEEALLYDENIFAVLQRGGRHTIRVFDLATGTVLSTPQLPDLVSVKDLWVDAAAGHIYFTLDSFLDPPALYKFNFDDGSYLRIHQPISSFQGNTFEVSQESYKSYDGVEIPLWIIRKKGLIQDGRHPLLLYAYGGFGKSITPSYNTTGLFLFQAFLENGGVCAIAHPRGGGEFGNDWHQAGSREKKQQSFNDFQAAAEYLCSAKYSSPDRLAIFGRSNGGLVMGVSLTQRPDLFGAVVAENGLYDMLRYHRFTIGWMWKSEYGQSDDPSDFDYLFSYSPLHRIERGNYPPTLIMAGENDDRVYPVHSYKFVAKLQNYQTGDAPILLRIDKQGDHQGSREVQSRIEKGAEVLCFIMDNLNMAMK